MSRTTTTFVGEKIGDWTVEAVTDKRIRDMVVGVVRCKCGYTHEHPIAELRAKQVQSCRACQHDRLRTGYGHITGQYWSMIQGSARKKKLVFDLTIEQAWNKYEDQNRRCALTGWPIWFVTIRDVPFLQTASPDRIDSTKGYTIDNFQWLHRKINYLKSNYDQEEFVEMCKAIAAHKG